MKFSCEKCGRSYVADEKVRGRAFKMKCKTCGSVIVVKPGAPAAHDPFALSPADPFSLPAGDPFAKPPADPFVTATREEAPQGGAARPAEAPQELELEIPSDDPFARAAQAEAAPAPHSVPAPADAVTTPGLPQLSEADAMFADLAEEMRTAHPPAAELPPAPAPAPAESAAPP
ncbi:MAG: hypothetical protein ACJ79E_20440, partial [Anaeromyxobacteraceae bacterium]